MAGTGASIEASASGARELQAPPLERVSASRAVAAVVCAAAVVVPGSVGARQPVLQRPGGGAVGGRLDVVAMERTLSEVVRRHEALRTRFVAVDGSRCRWSKRRRRSSWRSLDLSALDGS